MIIWYKGVEVDEFSCLMCFNHVQGGYGKIDHYYLVVQGGIRAKHCRRRVGVYVRYDCQPRGGVP